jgi:pSer/pThr/pTyr-binding forkhead associated (FHA) protein
MITCPFCGAQHVANTVFCGECGSYLLEDGSAATDPLSTAEEDALQEGALLEGISETASSIQQEISNTAETPSVIRLTIVETGRTVEANLEKAILFGRQDPSTDTYPEVDLTNDRGAEKGVSRRHARLSRRAGRILLEDIGSVNGTFVNDTRLAAYLPQVVHDGDQIKLGKLVISVEFA